MKSKCRRFLSLLVALVMVIGMVPVSILAAEDKANTIQLSVGQSYTFEDVPGDLTGDDLPEINTDIASISANLNISTDGVIMGGNSVGSKVPLENAAHVFDFTGTANTYYIYSPDYVFGPNNQTGNCYLSSFNGGHTQTETTSLISFTGADDGSVYIYTSNSAGSRYLYIDRDTMAWNKVNTTAGFERHCTFYIYGAVENESESSQEMFGYKKITDLADIVSGEKYLVAFYNANNELYVVDVTYMASTAYGQMLKVDAGLTTDLTVTAVGVGNTTVTIGGTTYTIEVVSTPAEAANLTVTARYITNRLSWNIAEGMTYTVQRSEDGEAWSDLGTASGAYIDENAGLNTQYFYRLVIDGEGDPVYTKAKQASHKTGMDALKATAALFYAGNDEIVFNGTNKVVIAEGDEAAALSAMNEGTIVYKAKFADISGKKAVLGTNTGNFVGANSGAFRHELGGGFNGSTGYGGMTAGSAVTAGFAYNDGNGHWALCFGDNAATTQDLDPARFGMLTATNATTYYAGGSSSQPFSGTINYILVTSEILTDEELETLTAMNQDHDAADVSLPDPALGDDIGQMLEVSGQDDHSNSWMFDGGRTTAGSITEIGGIRSYVYQFEEYVRWIQRGSNSNWNGRQRYTINVGKAGQTLADSLAKFDARAAALDPRAAVYLVGAEDYEAGQNGVEAFKTNLAAYIEKALALRGNNGFAVIQTPYPNDASENDELYAQAVRASLNELPMEIKDRVVLADHNAAENWGEDDYNADGSLSGWGHYEMGRQLSLAVCGTTGNYQTMTTLTAVPAPASYSDAAPTVTSGNNAIVISGLEDKAWTVEIALESYTLTVDAVGSVLTFEDLPAGEDYTLTVTASDWSVRLPIMEGTVNGSAQPYSPERSANQQAMVQLGSGSEPVTWLFMGDSITHGAAHTYGYDSISQIFEKFVKDDLGRSDDIVINTAVSSASTPDTISEIESRLNRYQPDVVSIMLGTNDSAASIGEDAYKQNLRTLIAAIQARGARVILRTPTPTKNDTRPNIGDYADWMDEVAAEYTDVILVEQYDAMSEIFAAAPYMKDVFFHSADTLHPTTEGHIWMCNQFLEATGLLKDGYVANLWYESGSEKESNLVPPVVFAEGTATLDTAAFEAIFGQALYTVCLMASDNDGRVYSIEGAAGETLTMSNLPADVTFRVEAHLANSDVRMSFIVPKIVDQDVTLKVGESVSFEDHEDYYVGANTDALDTNVASVEITGTVTEYGYIADGTVASIESGGKYIIVNTRAGKTLTNGRASTTAAAGSGNGLSLNGTAETISNAAIWTIEGADGSYSIKDANGRYLTIVANGASVSTDISNVDMAFNGTTWVINKNDFYLNDFGGKGTCAAGWKDGTAAGDPGSQWAIYKVREVAVDGTSVITFTGVAPGTTSVQIGFVNYHIIVEEADPSGPDDDYRIPECDKDESCVLSEFVDVDTAAWYHDGVHFCVEQGIMNGMGGGKFAPGETAVRAQLVTMLYRLAGEPSIEGLNEPFSDVKENDWFYAPIVWAYNNKIINGVSQTTFEPGTSVSREQVATILHRYLGTPTGTGNLDAYPDADKVLGYARDAMAWAVGEGLIVGIAQGDGTSLLDPAGNANRAQIATILMRYLTA
ncbi:MAG: S-layer homology domain-containing protein [Oscillospiraceae bacterium]|nr:S-layer homology domain-containing protein [Oscillospiraceae bacterium]